MINGLSDAAHPTQALTDIYTIQESKKKIKGVRIAFVGDVAQNTANSLMLAAVKMGAEMVLIGPKNYQPNSKYLVRAREYGVVDIYDSLSDGLANVGHNLHGHLREHGLRGGGREEEGDLRGLPDKQQGAGPRAQDRAGHAPAARLQGRGDHRGRARGPEEHGLEAG